MGAKIPYISCYSRRRLPSFPRKRESRNPLILNLLKDGPPPFRPIRSFPPPLPILQQVQDERMGAAAAPLPSFPRKRESGGGRTVTVWSFQYRSGFPLTRE